MTEHATMQTHAIDQLPTVDNELDLMETLLPLDHRRIIELGCGNARTARDLLARHPGCTFAGLEVDTVQHAKNLQAAQPGMQFVAAGAQAIPFPDASFDVALMLKSLHHVPMPDMAMALDEIARVLVPDGLLYVSEPIYDGALNTLVRLYNDEGVVRAAAQRALDDAIGGTTPKWEAVAERRFAVPVRFENFDQFEQRMMRPSFADHRLDDARVAAVREAYAPHQGPDGAHFVRPTHVRLLRRTAAAGH